MYVYYTYILTIVVRIYMGKDYPPEYSWNTINVPFIFNKKNTEQQYPALSVRINVIITYIHTHAQKLTTYIHYVILIY